MKSLKYKKLEELINLKIRIAFVPNNKYKIQFGIKETILIPNKRSLRTILEQLHLISTMAYKE